MNAGDELEDRLCPLEDCLNGRRTEDAEDIGIGSYVAGIAMKDGLPREGPVLVGPNVGVDEADFAVAGEVSVLP